MALQCTYLQVVNVWTEALLCTSVSTCRGKKLTYSESTGSQKNVFLVPQ